MFRITKQEDGYHASKTVEFEFGKLGQDKVDENGNKLTFAVAMNVPNTMAYYEQLLLERTYENTSKEDFKELLNTYFQLRLADLCGVNEQPLKYEDGKVLGLKEGQEYEFVEGKEE